jgi:SP family arabinose:H+ symporter-like MFS transporter
LPAGLFLVLVCFIRESPRWLAEKQRDAEALAVLGAINGREAAQRELDDIRRTIAGESGSLRQLLEPRWRAALIIGLVLPIAGQTSGINSIIYYGTKIFEDAGLSLGASLGGSVSIGIILCACTLLAMWKVDQLGRRPFLLIGAGGCVLSLLALSLLFALHVHSGPWLLVAMALFLGFFAFSLGPIPWIVISEIFPTSIRGRAMSVGTFALWIACAIVSQTFPWLIQTFGSAGTFAIYAALTAIFLAVLARRLPETKGKSLEQIERDWQRSHKISPRSD